MANPNTISTLIFLFVIVPYGESFCIPDHATNGTNSSNQIEAMKRIGILQGVTWDWNNFALGVCPLQLANLATAGAVQKTGKRVVVLGRTNRTHAAYGENWVLVIYRGGDHVSTPQCAGNYSSEILFICDASETHDGSAQMIEQDACIFRFQVKTSILCQPEASSIFTSIIIWMIFLFSLYCLVGIIYKRYKVRARGRQQIPHFGFWSKIGENCADCCNWACRCKEEMPSTWDDETDRDDTLLRP